MSAVVIPFGRPLPLPRVEISSPGTSKEGDDLPIVDLTNPKGVLQ